MKFRSHQNTTENDATKDDAEHPMPSIIPLTEGHLACSGCGIAVDASLTTQRKAGVETIEVPTYGPTGRETKVTTVSLARCLDCERIDELATKIVAAHPAMTRRLGAHRAQEAAAGMLHAHAALALKLPISDGKTLTDTALGSLVRNLGTLGIGLTWRVRLGSENVGLSARVPYGVATEDDMARLRSGRAQVLAERVARTRPAERITPPTIDRRDVPSGNQIVANACLLCGVDAVTVPALTVVREGGPDHVAAEQWTLRSSVDARSLGGRGNPRRVAGWTCTPCSEAITWAEALGFRALAQAIFTHFDYRPEHIDATLDGAQGFGALVSNARQRGSTPPSPNSTPWAHMRWMTNTETGPLDPSEFVGAEVLKP